MRTVALAIEARPRFPRVCVELVILVSSARSVSEEKIDDVYVCVVDCAEYFQCQSNGRFADPYNCARGKYFECNFSEKSKTRQPWTMPSSACCSLSRYWTACQRHLVHANVSGRTSIQRADGSM